MPGSGSTIVWTASTLLVTGSAALLYARGWQRLPVPARPARWRAATFGLALLLALVATTSRLDRLVNSYFTARAVQHLLIVELAPLLFWLGTPYRPLRAALPGLAGYLRRQTRLLAALRALTLPGVVWAAFVSLFWLWHDGTLLAVTARQPWLHRLEIVSLSSVAMLYWWHISAAAPHLHRPLADWQRMALAFAGIAPIKLTGIIMLFGEETGAGRPDPTTLQAGPWLLSDTALAAIFIWIVGGAIFIAVTIWIGSRLLGIEERKKPLPDNPIESDDLWRLPHRERRKRPRSLR